MELSRSDIEDLSQSFGSQGTGKDSSVFDTLQQSIDELSNRSMELSRPELEDLFQDFIIQSTGQGSSIFDLETSIGTFPIDEMSLSFSNLST